MTNADWKMQFFGRIISAGHETPRVCFAMALACGEKAQERREAKDTREQGRYAKKAIDAHRRALRLSMEAYP